MSASERLYRSTAVSRLMNGDSTSMGSGGGPNRESVVAIDGFGPNGRLPVSLTAWDVVDGLIGTR